MEQCRTSRNDVTLQHCRKYVFMGSRNVVIRFWRVMHRGACKDFSRGLSERSERYPRLAQPRVPRNPQGCEEIPDSVFDQHHPGASRCPSSAEEGSSQRGVASNVHTDGRMFKTVLIANRGVIACRIIRTLRRLGVSPVSVFSEADRHSRHVEQSDTAVLLGPPAAAMTSTLRSGRSASDGFP